jgi:hypothetical protein
MYSHQICGSATIMPFSGGQVFTLARDDAISASCGEKDHKKSGNIRVIY